MREPSFSRHPMEDMEPEVADADAYREASERGLRLIDCAMRTILSTSMTKETQVAFWQISFGIGLRLCEGRSMNDVANDIGVTRASLSKGAKAFQRKNGLPVNQYMKDAEAVRAYSDARNDQLNTQ